MKHIKRLLKHSLAWRPSYVAAFNDACLAAITQAVALSEQKHTAQICVITEQVLPLSYLRRNASCRERAITLFGKHRVWDTDNNAGILIYINFVDQAVEFVADRGLSAVVSEEQWRIWALQSKSSFQSGSYQSGLVLVIEQMTQILVMALPRQAGTEYLNAQADEAMRL